MSRGERRLARLQGQGRFLAVLRPTDRELLALLPVDLLAYVSLLVVETVVTSLGDEGDAVAVSLPPPPRGGGNGPSLWSTPPSFLDSSQTPPSRPPFTSPGRRPVSKPPRSSSASQ